MAVITIGIVASSREWRSILQAHVRDHVADVKVQILREPRMALELDLDVVVIDDVSSFLTRDKVVRLREKGTRVVGIYDPEGHEGLGITFLENLGVDLSLPSNISPEEMISAVSQLQPKENYSHAFDHAVADFASAPSIDSDPGNSTLVTVAGPAGCGSTEVAIALADILVARRNATLLLDCDEVGPSVARRLGFHLHPNILSAMDAVANVTRPITEMVGRPSDRAASSVNFDVIPGIANPEDWSQLRSTDMSDLFSAARKSWRYIVCNTGPFTEDLSGYGMERFGGTRAALEYADIIIGVMSPTPTGYMRFLDWMTSLRTIGHERAVYIVVNRSPKSGFVRSEIESQLSRDMDSRYIAGLYFVPEDERVLKAEWEGQLVPRGPFVNTVAGVATDAIPMHYVKKGVRARVASPATTQAGQGGFSGAPIVAPTPTSWSDQGPQQPPTNVASISWDDADIAAQAVQAQPEVAPQHFEPQSNYVSGSPEISLDPESIAQLEEIENSISETMQTSEDATKSVPPIPPSDDHNNYSFSPPLHATQDVGAPQPQQQPPSQPQHQNDPVGEGYVPAYKRESQDDTNPNTNQFVVPDQPVQAQPQNYVAQQPPTKPQGGYVPGFVEEDEEKPGDEKFWGNNG